MAETAVEAYRLQIGMSKAAGLLQHVLNDAVAGREAAVPRVMHRWAQPPGALVRPRLPFGGTPAPAAGPVLEGEEREMTLKAVARWAEGRFHPVRERQVLLLAPADGPAAWPQARPVLEDLAGRLPRPGLLGWCGVPVVSVGEAG